jgi:uracil-DNA glycosylase family 4
LETKQHDMTPHAAAEALRWLAEMGAGDVIGETPVNRLKPPAAPQPVAPPKPAAEGRVQARAATAPTGTLGAPGASAPGPAAACMSLAEIEAALESFDACPLKKTATRLCYADGNPSARVMLVGEAPGRDEDIQGKPFVGRSGQLLDRMLAAVGLSRTAQDRESAVFITNTIFWRPPGNRTPTEAETQMCLPFLLRTIELQKPDVIVCLGATPAHRLTGRSDGILKLRGKWVTANVSGRNIPLLPTLHPAYLLRQPAQKRLAWRDLLSLRQILDAH